MNARLQQLFSRGGGLELEEKILNGASIFAALSVFLPWFSGEWLGEEYVVFSGFEFFTSMIGIVVFLLHVALLATTLIPLFGGPVIVRRRYRDVTRLCLATLATTLCLAALSVLTKMTYDYTRMEIRFGIYFTFIGSLIAAFYSFWRLQEARRAGSAELFHHPDDQIPPQEHAETPVTVPPPPPPPPPLQPEEHHIRPL